jgi:hypothetical protein
MIPDAHGIPRRVRREDLVRVRVGVRVGVSRVRVGVRVGVS